MKISRVVVPAAGLGTRFLPVTKSVPKEMLPIWDKPAIHYILKEVVLSGIKDVSLIVSKDKNAIADYFDYSFFLDQHLNSSKPESLSELDFIVSNVNLNYIRQPKPKGLGHAILLSKSFVEDFFAISLPDDIIFSKKPVLMQLEEVAKKYSASVIAVQEVSEEKLSSYGVIKIKSKLDGNIFEIEDVIEKPKDNPPSNLAVIGRYILSSKIYDFLENSEPDFKGEIQLTSAISNMIRSGEKVLALKFEGDRFDIGTPQGLFSANQKFHNILSV